MATCCQQHHDQMTCVALFLSLPSSLSLSLTLALAVAVRALVCECLCLCINRSVSTRWLTSFIWFLLNVNFIVNCKWLWHFRNNKNKTKKKASCSWGLGCLPFSHEGQVPPYFPPAVNVFRVAALIADCFVYFYSTFRYSHSHTKRERNLTVGRPSLMSMEWVKGKGGCACSFVCEFAINGSCSLNNLTSWVNN